MNKLPDLPLRAVPTPRPSIVPTVPPLPPLPDGERDLSSPDDWNEGDTIAMAPNEMPWRFSVPAPSSAPAPWLGEPPRISSRAPDPRYPEPARSSKSPDLAALPPDEDVQTVVGREAPWSRAPIGIPPGRQNSWSSRAPAPRPAPPASRLVSLASEPAPPPQDFLQSTTSITPGERDFPQAPPRPGHSAGVSQAHGRREMWAAASQQREAASASQIAPPNFEGTGVAPAVLDDDAFSGADFSDFSDLAAAAVAPAPAPEPPLRPSLENTGFMTAAVHDLKLERSSPVMTLQFEPDPEPATPSMAPAEPVLAKELCRGEYEQSAICEDLTPIRRSASPARRSRAPDSGETLGIADYVQDREPAPKPRPSTAAKGRTTSASGKPLSTSDPRARLQVAPRLRRNASFPGSDLLRQFPRWYMAIIALSLVLLAAGVVTFVLR